MSQDYETKQSDLRASRNATGGDRPAAEDPLVELARIVHKNKQSGANVSSGRVGSTDYFAELEDMAVDPAKPSQPDTQRREPTFTPVAPVVAAPVAEQPPAPETTTFPPAAGSVTGDQPQAFEARETAEAPPSSHVSSLWPDVQSPQAAVVTPDPAGTVSNVNVAAEGTLPEPDYPTGPVERYEPVAANDQSSPAPALAVDLEQGLKAELEDELIGALRQSVDDTAAPEAPQIVSAPDPAPVEPIAPNLEAELLGLAPGAAPQPDSQRDDFGVAASEPYRVEVTPPRVEPSAPTGFAGAVSPPTAPAETTSYAAGPEQVAAQIRAEEPRVEPAPFDEPIEPVEPVTAARPRIDEDDLFAALNPAQEAPAPAPAPSETGRAGEPAGIDALFADLDFPPPGERKAAPPVEEAPQDPQPEPVVAAADIDDMTWPAAAAEVPKTPDDETPPPPEGYDLDAVARAMQESDPSLTGAGVLPPHSDAEKEAVPQAAEKSRRGLFVAAGVLGVAVLGAAGFFLVDSDGVVVPSGPPPVISGLQEPLKIYPEESPPPADNQSAKLIYDRVDGNNASGPDSLVVPETPKPAELPPAPAGVNDGADLVPGAPKRVRTVIVRPDGTFVTEDQPSAAPSAAPAASAPAVAPAPAVTPEPSVTPPVNDSSRVVATTPIVGAPAPAQPETPVATPEPAAPADPASPAIVAANAEAASQPQETQPPAEIVNVLPRKKPAAPVQVASAPPAAATPAPATQTSGPLNLSQTVSAPAAAAPAAPAASGATGSIASGTYIVQVTSQRSAAAASDAYSGLQRQFPSILGNRNAVIVSANVQDRGVFYRARIPTSSRAEAISLCESLQAAGGDCFVRRQP